MEESVREYYWLTTTGFVNLPKGIKENDTSEMYLPLSRPALQLAFTI